MNEKDLFGYLLYTAWREEQLLKSILPDHIEDQEMERLCSQGLEWPWDAVVRNG